MQCRGPPVRGGHQPHPTCNLEVAGDRSDLSFLSADDDAAGAFATMGLPAGHRSSAFAFSNAIAIVNGVVGGASVVVAAGSIEAFPSG